MEAVGQLCLGCCGGMWSIFYYLILCEKNFLGLEAPACLLDLGVCRFDALVVDLGSLCGLGGVRCRILFRGLCG